MRRRRYPLEGDAEVPLFQDLLAGISSIAWNLQDKVRSVSRASTNASAPDLEFRYGATGHRTVKVVKPRVSAVQQPASQWDRTYYIHDAQGNPMAIYHRTYQANGGTSYTDKFLQEDALLYGSKRLGNWNGRRLKTRALTRSTTAMTSVTYGPAPDWTNGQGGYPTTALSVTRDLGLRSYELSNHLGNVLSTVSDRRLAVASGSVLAYYRADEQSYADYDPYGMLLPGRFGGGFVDQKFGFQGQLKDDELNGSVGTSYAFEYRVHDPRVGRFLSIDPLAHEYPWNSPYVFSENNVICYVELEGLELAVSEANVDNICTPNSVENVDAATTASPVNTIKLVSDIDHYQIKSLVTNQILVATYGKNDFGYVETQTLINNLSFEYKSYSIQSIQNPGTFDHIVEVTNVKIASNPKYIFEVVSVYNNRTTRTSTVQPEGPPWYLNYALWKS